MRATYRKTGDITTDKLLDQFITRMARKARGGAAITRAKKIDRYKAFLRFVGLNYGPEDIVNINPVHTASYMAYKRSKGVTLNTILSELSVIRWWHARMYGCKYIMPENKVLFDLEVRLSDKEYCKEFKNKYRNKGQRIRRRII